MAPPCRRFTMVMHWWTAVCTILSGTFVYGEHPRTVTPVVTSVSISPQGDLMASAGDDHQIRIWKFDTGELLHLLVGHQDWVTSTAFSHDGRVLFSTGADGAVLSWNLESPGRPEILAESASCFAAMARFPSENRLAIVGFRTPLWLISLADSRSISRRECPSHDMRTVAVSPDGRRLAAGGRDGSIRIWESTGEQEPLNIQAHDQRLRALAYSLDGQRLISAGEDRAICIWNAHTGEEIRHISRSQGRILSMAVIDARRFATGTSENVVDLWDLDNGEHLGSLTGHQGSVAALTHHEHRLVSGSFDATVRLWDVTPGTPAVAIRVLDHRSATHWQR